MAIFYTLSCQTGGHIVNIKGIPMLSFGKPLGKAITTLNLADINSVMY